MALRQKKKQARYAEELPNGGIGANVQKHVIGGKELTQEEYNTAKGQLGMKSGRGGQLTPGVQGAVGNVQRMDEATLQQRAIDKVLYSQKIAELTKKPEVAPTPEELALVNQIGQPTAQEGPEFQDLTKMANIKSAGAGFAVEATPTILGTATTGALAGAAIGGVPTGGIGAVPGAIIGGAAGLVSGLLYKAISNVKAEAKEDTLSTKANFDAANSNLGSIVTGLNRGYLSQEEAVQLYNKQLAIIDRSERQLKELTKNNLNEFLSDGSTEMAKIVAFNSPGGEREFWDLRMKTALLKPDPMYGTQTTGGTY